MSTQLRLTAFSLAAALLLAGCQTTPAEQSSATASVSATSGSESNEASAFFNADEIHTIDVTFADADYQAMLDTYAQTEDKEWISATVTIDGTVFENVGLRLKGNSSLRSLSGGGGGQNNEGDGTVDAEQPEGLPWLIRLDKYVEGQSYAGRTDFVVRGNSSESSLNEAVALAMLAEAGVIAQNAAYAGLSVNGSEPMLRLIVDSPDDELWNDEVFGGGKTYKADSDGDYSYRGDDATSYMDIFTQRTGEDDMTPVIEFLDFINNSSDEEFASQLSQKLDVESFATYLAAEDLIRNNDAIDGMGNNSYLHFDSETGQMTVVAWDHNLAFSSFGGGRRAGGGGRGDERAMPGDFEPGTQGGEAPAKLTGGRPEMPADARGNAPGVENVGQVPQSGLGGPGEAPIDDATDAQTGMMVGMGGKENPLVTRFLADEDYAQLYRDSLEKLSVELVDSGFADGILTSYTELLLSQGGGLVAQASVESDAERIRSQLQTKVSGRL